MALTLPNAPRIFDADPLGQAQEGYKFGKGILDEQNTVKGLTKLDDWIRSQQQAPQPGSSILDLMGASQPTAVQAAEQLAQPRQPGGAIVGTPDDAWMSSYINSTAQSESGGSNTAKNPNSSATGKYQFLEGTWNDLAQQNPGLGLTPDGRTDPAQQERAMKVFTAQNAKHIAGAGIPVNPGNLYAAHLLGAGGATQVLTQPDNTPVASLVGPGVVEANPFLAQMTVGQFKQWAAQKGGGQGGGYQAPVVGQSAPAAQLPPRDVMQALFAAPATRQFAVDLAKAAQEGAAPPELTSEQRNFMMAQQDPAFAQFLTGPTERDIRKGPDGVERYVDTGEPVFPGVSAPVEAPGAPDTKTIYDETTGQEQVVQWNPTTQAWDKVGGQKAPSGGNGLSITTPDGTVIQQGSGLKLTEGQGKDIGFYTRGASANEQLSTFGNELTNLGQQAAGMAPFGLGNYMRSPEFRQAKVAADNFIASILRKDSGAAITPDEFALYGPMFLPVPGDDPATLGQKSNMREIALLGIRSGLGTAEAVAKANEAILGLEPPNPTPPGQSSAPADAAPTVTATNPQTGEKLILQNGQWVPAP